MAELNPDALLTVFGMVAERNRQVFFVFDVVAQQFSYLSPSARQLWKDWQLPSDTQPTSLITLLHPEDKAFAAEAYQTLLNGREKKDVELRFILSGQPERWLCISPFLLQPEAGKRYLAGFAQDITVNKEHIDTLKRFAAKKNSLLEILSHDLAGPLGVIKALASMLARKVESYEDVSLKEITGLIEKTCARNVKLIRDFVAQEFLESANVDLIKQRVDLIEKIGEVIEQYKNSERDLPKTFQLLASGPVYAHIDDVKFMQVINNLLSNAIKFTHDDGVITISVEEKEATVLITVADNGIGIPIQLQQGLFEKFTKARRPGIRGEESTGLGMSIIKTIIDWHGGKIWFQSKEGQGSTFHIALPKE